jgi:cell division protein FtsL
MKPKVKLRIVVGVVFSLLSLFSVPLVAVWKKSRVLEMVTVNENLKVQEKSLQGEILLLDYAVAKLKNRERIEVLAAKECGLAFPANQDVTVLLKPSKPEIRKAPPALFSAAAFIR